MPAQSHEPEAINVDAVDAVLAAHDGDIRAAIAGLLDDVEYLLNQITYASLAVSRGYTRGWLPTHERKVADER